MQTILGILNISRKDGFTVRKNVIDTPITLSCGENGSGELDDIIQNILYNADDDSWPAGPCVSEKPTVDGGNGVITADLDTNGYQYITINEQFTGSANITGKYNNGTEVVDYTFTITTDDYIPVEMLTLSPDTAKTMMTSSIARGTRCRRECWMKTGGWRLSTTTWSFATWTRWS